MINRWTDVEIRCDYPDCKAQAWGSHLDVDDPVTAGKVRRLLKKRGWTHTRRGDWCPKHGITSRGISPFAKAGGAPASR